MKTFALLLLFFVVTPAMADKVLIDEPNLGSVQNLDAELMRQLLKNATTQLGHTLVHDMKSADSVLRTSLLRLGNSYVFSVERWGGGKLLGSSKLKIKDIEEIEEITPRAVRSAMAGTDIKEDVKMDEVTIAETEHKDRKRPNRSGGVFAAGPAILGNLGSSGVAYYMSLGHGWAMGHRARLGLRADFAIDPDRLVGTALVLGGNINFTWFFLNGETSPFLTGDFGWALTRRVDASASGAVQLGGIAGIALFRTYNVHVQLGIHGAALLDSNYSATGTPYLFALRLGAGF